MATYIIDPPDLARIRQTADIAAFIGHSKVIIEMKDGERIIGEIVGKVTGSDSDHDGIEIEVEYDGMPLRTAIDYRDIAWIG